MSGPPPEPLVSIGLPAYNRPASLRRAAESALAQSHHRLELIVSDDASPDPAVGAVAEALAAGDPRVRVVRQQRNLGHARNYQYVLDVARGEYFMWLSDDDWLDPDYVQRCLSALRRDPSLALVCGVPVYEQPGEPARLERALNLTARRPGLRVLSYFTKVSTNGTLFSLARRDDFAAVGFPDVPGGDWTLCGMMAARGGVLALPDVHIHRSPAGLGSDAERLARGFGLRGIAARNHHVLVAARIAREIVGAPAYRRIPIPGRALVAVLAAGSILLRFPFFALVQAGLGPRAGLATERLISWLLRRLDAR